MTHIRFDNVTFDYPVLGAGQFQLKREMLRVLTGGRIHHAGSITTVRALDAVSFTIQDGERIGLRGRNGSGKSTLLRVISGIYYPTDGTVDVQGSVAPLISIDVGIDEELTGYENIYRRCLLLGMRKRAIREIIEEVTEFSELGEFITLPVRTYSAGMRTRLVFSIATTIRPDILVLDEWLSAGDAEFVRKAEARMRDVVGQSNILVMASHSDRLLEETCTRIITLDSGRIVEDKS